MKIKNICPFEGSQGHLNVRFFTHLIFGVCGQRKIVTDKRIHKLAYNRKVNVGIFTFITNIETIILYSQHEGFCRGFDDILETPLFLFYGEFKSKIQLK